MQSIPEGARSQEIRQRSTTVRGAAEKSFLILFRSKTISSLRNSNPQLEHDCYQSLPNLLEKDTLARAMVGPGFVNL